LRMDRETPEPPSTRAARAEARRNILRLCSKLPVHKRRASSGQLDRAQFAPAITNVAAKAHVGDTSNSYRSSMEASMNLVAPSHNSQKVGSKNVTSKCFLEIEICVGAAMPIQLSFIHSKVSITRL
jgi:hypothetical protein